MVVVVGPAVCENSNPWETRAVLGLEQKMAGLEPAPIRKAVIPLGCPRRHLHQEEGHGPGRSRERARRAPESWKSPE